MADLVARNPEMGDGRQLLIGVHLLWSVYHVASRPMVTPGTPTIIRLYNPFPYRQLGSPIGWRSRERRGLQAPGSAFAESEIIDHAE